jgi:hypothetical protein
MCRARADIVLAMTPADQFKTRSAWATRVEIAGFALTAVVFSLHTMSVEQGIAWVCVLGGATISASFLIRRGLKCPRCEHSLSGSRDIQVGRCSQCRLGFHHRSAR